MKKKFLIYILLFVLLHSCGNGTPNGQNNTPDNPTGQFYGDPFADIPTTETIIMYEANERVFAANGSFNAITARLSEIRSFGVNVLWLMPVTEQGKEKAIGSPYCIKNFTNTEPTYGTLDDLRDLVKKAHELKMAVIIDWVANHTSWDNDWIKNKAWYTTDASGNIISPEGTGWNDVADLNYNNSDLRKAMIDAMKYWVREANIDGFRCDAADMVPTDFWREAISELRDLQSGRKLLLLAEGTSKENLAAGFDMDYGWSFMATLKSLYDGSKSVNDLYVSHRDELNSLPLGKQKLRFSTNHDESATASPLTIYKNAQGALSAFVIAATMGGLPLMYSSQEVSYPKALSFFSYQPIDWTANADRYAQYKKLLDVHSKSVALQKGILTIYNDADFVLFQRATNSQTIYIVVNIRNAAKTLNFPSEWVGTTCSNLMNDTPYTIPANADIEPYGFFVLSK